MRPDVLRRHADEVASLEPRLFWFRSRGRLLRRALRRYFPDARRVCELGCGTGFVLDQFRQELPAVRLVGGDAHLEGLDTARRRVRDAGFVQLDVLRLPFRPVFDVVGLFDVLEHIEDDAEALREVAGILRPGGGLMITVPQHRWLWSPVDEFSRHFRRYERTELVERLAATGYTVRRVTSFTSFLLPALVAARRRSQPLDEGFDPLAEYRLPTVLNETLMAAMECERFLIERGASLPAGGSLFIVAARS